MTICDATGVESDGACRLFVFGRTLRIWERLRIGYYMQRPPLLQ